MQKQLIPLSAKWPGRQGSILVGVVALTVVMSLAAIGFIQISGSMANNGSASIEDTRAFYAVESGLILGARFLREQANFNAIGLLSTPLPFSPIEINGATVDVSVCRLSNPDRIQITSKTFHYVKGTGYKKQMTWEANSNFGQYAFVMGKEHPDNGWASQPYDWNGWGGSNVWIGRLHMNSRIKIGRMASYTFSGGPVTVSLGDYDSYVASDPNLAHMNYTKRWTDAGRPLTPNINGFLNNFDDGVAVCASNDGGGHAQTWNLADTAHQKLNTWFQDRFTANQPMVELKSDFNNSVWNSAPGNVVELATSEAPSGAIGDGAGNYRPTLYFNEERDGSQSYGRVTYRYYKSSAFKDTSWAVDGKVFKSNTSINVLGVVTGKTTVVTTDGNSIVIVADGRNNIRGNSLPGIVYQDYTIGANGLPVASGANNVLGLISGKDIVYNKTWWKRTGATNETITIADHTQSRNCFLNVCGSIVATETNTSCDRIDLTLQLNYGIRAYGSHIVSAYRTHTQSNKGTVYSINGTDKLYNNQYIWDERLAQITYPNSIDRITNASGLLMLNYFNWKETNL